LPRRRARCPRQDGDWPSIEAYSEEALSDAVDAWREEGIRRNAVITRGQAEAVRLSKRIRGAILLTGDGDDMLPESGGW
jgi:hypothetical protein